MKLLPRSLKGHLRLIVISCLSLAALAGLLLYKLGSLTGSLSQSEVSQQVFSSSWQHIADNPLNLPYTALQWLFLTISPHHGNTVTRLPSIFFGALSIVAFAYVVRRWYGARAAIFSTILFACSSWVLHISRFAGPDVLYLAAIPTLLAMQIAWERHGSKLWVSWAAVAVIALLLYIPGVVWLVLLSFGLHPAQLIRSWKHLHRWWQQLATVVVSLLLLTPLVVSFGRQNSLAKTWIGLPTHFETPHAIGKGLLHSVSYLFYHGPTDPQRWLDHVPVLDVLGMVMLLLGIIFYVRHLLAPRTRQLAGLWIIGAVFFALGGPVSYSLLIPVAYLLVAAGLGYVLHEWLRVFPRNPFARTAAYSLLGLVVAVSCVYNLRSYFIAWPHSPSTVAAFRTPRE